MSYWGIVMPKMVVNLKFINVLIISIILYQYNNSNSNINKVLISKREGKSHKRIGPHNIDIVSVLIGSLLGDGYLEKHGNGYRLHIQQENSNKGYLNWLHEFFAIRNYTNAIPPKINKRIGNKGKIRYVLRFKTYSYRSLYYYHENFYKNNIKIVPSKEFLELHFTPLSLAIWIMNEGSRVGSGLKLSTNCFTFKECEI